MKPHRIALAALVAATTSGCAGLHVSWVATASYNAPAATAAVLQTGVPAPAAQTCAKPGEGL